MANLVSGMVIAGTGQASELAQRITSSSFNRGGHCGIVIANESGHTLVQPHRYVYAGYVGNLPINIPSSYSGLITAAKTFGSPWGANGVISYNIKDTDLCFLVLYSVPFYTTGEEIKVNVAIGNRQANNDVYDSMISNNFGELIRARNTAHVYRLSNTFEAEAYMGDSGPSPLTIVFKKRATATNVEA